MNCPKCGTPNAKFIDEKGRSRGERRQIFGGPRKSLGERWREETMTDKIKCRKCGVIE